MALASKLAVWRADLIDMSRSNPLLYYRSSGRGAGIQLAVQDANTLFARLLRSRRGQTIEVGGTVPPLEAEELERRLGRLHARARADLNDRGLSTLFLAFGMLEWREAASSEDVVRSPLVLMPVTLVREGIWSPYQIQRLGEEELEINPTLGEKLAHDFKVHLPTYAGIVEAVERGESDATSSAGGRSATADKRQVSLATLFSAVRAAIPSGPTWRIVSEVHLGRFSFQKLVMYEDLDAHEAEVLGHPLLRVLGGDQSKAKEPLGVIAAADLDRRIDPRTTLQVMDADSSQEEAIVAAKAGSSFVLQGPPGTGKSQTIANIIAESLGQGRRVLFVSEKMAALEVVRQRLQECGLGDFCLDLHNPRADKKAFIQDLQESLADGQQAYTGTNERDWQKQSDDLARARDALNTYVAELHRKRYAMEISAFEAYGRLARLDSVPDAIFAVGNVQEIGERDFARMRAALDELLASADVLDQYTTYPWRETLANSYTLELAADIRALFGRLNGELDACDERLWAIQALIEEGTEVRTFAWARRAIRWAELALESPLPPGHWLDRTELERVRRSAGEVMAQSQVYWERRNRIGPLYDHALLDLDHGAFLHALTEGSAWALSRIVAGGQSAPDYCIDQRGRLESLLNQSCQALDDLIPTAKDAADACGLADLTSGHQVDALRKLTACLLETPRPPIQWLNHDAFPEIRVSVREAWDAYATTADLDTALKQIYEPTYFDVDLTDIVQRYRESYVSPIRYLRLGYYADNRRLRSLAKSEIRRTGEELKADLFRREKLVETRAWIAAHRRDHAAALGHFFADEHTDWDHVGVALNWAESIQRQMHTVGTTQTVVDIACGPVQAQTAARTTFLRLERAWVAWERLLPDLVALLDTTGLTADGLGLDDAPLTELKEALERMREALRAFWDALDTMDAHRLASVEQASGGDRRAWADRCEDLRAAREAHAFEIWMEANKDELRRDYGDWFQGPRTDWARARRAIDWAERFMAEWGDQPIPTGLAELVCAGADNALRGELRAAYESASSGMAHIDQDLAAAERFLPQSALLAKGTAQDEAALTGLAARIRYLADNLPALEQWLICRGRLWQCRELGLGGLVDSLLGNSPFPRTVREMFERRFYALWLDETRKATPVLARFRGETHAQLRVQFAQLDQEHLRLARERVKSMLRARRRLALSQDQLDRNAALAHAVADLKREALLKRHRSIRQIVRKIGPALMEVRPCWMMSPLSVSQFVASGDRQFDLVIFDEASQVCAEDAICAILRGTQLIVVGDSKQLPPTRFFTKSLGDGDDELDDVADEGADRAESDRVESILDECLAADFTERSLLWHYRSRHESLIAFSNHHFYRDNLITFPSSEAEHNAGVRYVYVADGVYDRSRTRTNRAEAERVVDLVFEHMRERPEMSLGVVALSEAQQRAIHEALEARFKKESELKAWEKDLDEDDPAGFFIKNLESVQGDERDVILLSIGYGRDKDGRTLQNFGPVNRKGGERRLNVAVTRARYQMIVVASMHAAQLPADMASAGARALRDYLDYAEHGTATLRGQTPPAEAASAGYMDDHFDSPFEEDVCEALRSRGLDLATQVGCSGFRIDLAVRDEEDPGKFLLGIECDGRTYHSSHTARDRDRLRQRHLELMGWTIHRIWSSDWISDRGREIEKVMTKVAGLTEARQHETRILEDNPGEPRGSTFGEPRAERPVGAPSLSAERIAADYAPTVAVVHQEANELSSRDQTSATRMRPGNPPARVLPQAPRPDASGRNQDPPKSQARAVRESGGPQPVPIDVVAYLRSKKLEIIDMRPGGGRLWVVGGPGLAALMAQLSAQGHQFDFVRAGGKATGGRPAWYLDRERPR